MSETTIGKMRYHEVNGVIFEQSTPPLTRHEATRAVRKLARHFLSDERKRERVIRRCPPNRAWLSRKPSYFVSKGWRRLAHDVSHEIFAALYPTKRPHDPLHEHYENQVATYIVEHKWLEGALLPKKRPPKPPPTEYEKRARELDNCNAAIKRWESKAKRAANALKKLRRKQVRLGKKLAETHAEEVDTLLLKM